MKYLKMLGLAAVAAMALTAFTAGSASATTLELGGVTQNKSTPITASVAAGGSVLLSNTEKTLANTCKVSIAGGSTTSHFTGEQVTGPLNELSFSSCTHEPVTVEAMGQLFVKHVGGTSGTVFAENQKVTVPTSLPGTSHVTCTTAANGTHIGTLSGVAAGTQTMTVNAVLNCGFLLPSALWHGVYTITTAGLGVSA